MEMLVKMVRDLEGDEPSCLLSRTWAVASMAASMGVTDETVRVYLRVAIARGELLQLTESPQRQIGLLGAPSEAFRPYAGPVSTEGLVTLTAGPSGAGLRGRRRHLVVTKQRITEALNWVVEETKVGVLV
ncbi:hypothetical protein [Kitasatospora sp. P5_F3]